MEKEKKINLEDRINMALQKLLDDIELLDDIDSDWPIDFEAAEQRYEEEKQRKNKKFIDEEKNIVSTLPLISDTINKICQNVIGQDDAVKKTTLAVYNNLDLMTKNLSESEIATLKNNVLISGKSGCGKTEVARQLAKHFDVPVCIEDITQYTGYGWEGKNLIELLKKIYLISNKNIEVAQRGILVLDEIDKIAIDKSNDRKSHSTLEIQQELLKMIEGGTYEIATGRNEISFDTKYLTIIGTGAFNGFNRDSVLLNEKGPLSAENKTFLKQDYINYGLMPEFVGRFKTFVTIKNLSFEDKKRILLESKLSVLNLRLSDLKSRGINIKIKNGKEKLCEEIIRRSEEIYHNECGVRDLNEITFNIFNNIYYRLYNGENPTNISFDESIVKDCTRVLFSKK